MNYSEKALECGGLSLIAPFQILKYNINFRKEHPDYFYPDGTILFTGPQGSGKTLSAVKYVRILHEQYPKAIIVSNIDLVGIPTEPYQGLRHLKDNFDNGEQGIICLIDELQNEFNSLDSKSLQPEVLATICQQRKRRLQIVGTSQLFTRVSKALREQIGLCVDCKGYFGFLQWNRKIDFDRCAYDINGNLTETAYSGSYIWCRRPSDYAAYDTTKILERVGQYDLVQPNERRYRK